MRNAQEFLSGIFVKVVILLLVLVVYLIGKEISACEV